MVMNRILLYFLVLEILCVAAYFLNPGSSHLVEPFAPLFPKWKLRYLLFSV
jgi:hypothetical protein